MVHIRNFTKVLGKVFECEGCGKILKNNIWKVLLFRFWVWSIVRVLEGLNLVHSWSVTNKYKKVKLGHYLTLGFKKGVRKNCGKNIEDPTGKIQYTLHYSLQHHIQLWLKSSTLEELVWSKQSKKNQIITVIASLMKIFWMIPTS